jgi:hypothetical protein
MPRRGKRAGRFVRLQPTWKSPVRSAFFGADVDALALALPSGPDRSVMDNLRRWLPAAARYDPERFRADLQAIRSAR